MKVKIKSKKSKRISSNQQQLPTYESQKLKNIKSKRTTSNQQLSPTYASQKLKVKSQKELPATSNSNQP
jgi:hypothetical protein